MLLLDYQNVLIESLLKDRFSGYHPIMATAKLSTLMLQQSCPNFN